MNSDQDSPRSKPGCSPGQHTGVDVRETVRSDGRSITTYSDSDDVDSRARSCTFEHDKQKRVFRLTDAAGKTEYFRENPARYLVVEPDPKTGEMRPARKHGKPTFIYICRENREL
ncbi:MAG: hypothetical protein ACHQ50_09095 [Fimbriimonadales bacterium]